VGGIGRDLSPGHRGGWYSRGLFLWVSHCCMCLCVYTYIYIYSRERERETLFRLRALCSCACETVCVEPGQPFVNFSFFFNMKNDASPFSLPL
jgi:hypothetical protein